MLKTLEKTVHQFHFLRNFFILVKYGPFWPKLAKVAFWLRMAKTFAGRCISAMPGAFPAYDSLKKFSVTIPFRIHNFYEPAEGF